MAIRADRQNYVMSVELAMQREMNYRQKLEKKGSQQSRVAEVPKPASSQEPRQTPRPTSNSFLRPTHGPICGPEDSNSVPLTRPPPYPAPHSRPSPSSAPSHLANQRQNGPVPLPEGIFTCKVCQLDCKTGFNLLSHYQGHKHKAKLREVKGKEVAGGPMPNVAPRANERRPYCDVCGIWCIDEYTYRLHFSCTNHILRQYDWLMKKRMYS